MSFVTYVQANIGRTFKANEIKDKTKSVSDNEHKQRKQTRDVDAHHMTDEKLCVQFYALQYGTLGK